MKNMLQLQFKNFITLQRGFDLPKKDRVLGEYPVVASTAINGYHTEHKVQPPGVVTGRSGSLGEVLYIDKPFWPLNTTLWVKDFIGNLPLYVYYFLKTLDLKQYNSGAGVPTLNRNHLDTLEIAIHDFESQRKIAAILSAYDDLIENNLRRIKILEEVTQSLYREWFVKFRFPCHEKVRMVDTSLGKIPDGWEVKGVMENRNWSFVRQNIRPFSGEKCYYATADIDEITITGEGILYTYYDKPSRAQKQPTLYSIWFARMQETYKVLAVAQPNATLAECCMLSSGFAGLEAPDEESFAFLFLTIKSEDFHAEKDRFCTGATQRSLTNDGLSRILTISPPREIVREFGRSAHSLIELILLLQRRNTALRRTRDLLLPKLISGELDVSELDIKTGGQCNEPGI